MSEQAAMPAAPVGSEGWSKWSSLPGDLVRRIADSFLASNDLDHYMFFRAVCPAWRSATDDPKEYFFDPRFRPRQWIVLDDVLQSEGRLLLLNANTGRFLHKKLPLLHEYYVVATTPTGFFVLADRSPPHAARVFNPLTGGLTRFAAALPPEVGVVEVGCDRFIYFLGETSHKIYTAAPESEGFTVSIDTKDTKRRVYDLLRDAIIGGAYPHISALGLLFAIGGFCTFLSPDSDFQIFLSGPLTQDAANNIRFRCFVMGLDAQVFLHIEIQGEAPIVLKMNTKIGKIEPVVECFGRFAIFVGHHGCLAVDADKFPSIEANCMYYTQHSGSSAHICKYNFKDKKIQKLSEAAEFMKQDNQFVLVVAGPFTIIELLCRYTINRRDSQMPM